MTLQHKRILTTAVAAVLVGGLSAAHAAQKSGDRCTKVDATAGPLRCVNSAKAGQRPILRWRTIAAPATPTSVAAATPETTPATTIAPPSLTIYSGRTYGIEQVYERFTKETGVKLTIVSASDTANRDRLRAEGPRTPADVYLTTDVGALTLATDEGLLESIKSPVLEKAIPFGFRDPKNHWFGLSKRSRVIFVNTKNVKPADYPQTYDDLASSTWNGRLCVRPASHVYTQSLAANLITVKGIGAAARILGGIAQNTKSQNFIDGDTKILETLNAGGCDAGLANTYYFGRASFANVKLIFPNQGQGQNGAHINLSGAGVVGASAKKASAIRFIEWLATTGQADYAGNNFEFTVNPAIADRPEVKAFGSFVGDERSIYQYSKVQPSAAIVLADAGWR